MDDKIINSCPNCCQTYSLKSLAPEPKSNIPLFIKCGHSLCEGCVRNIVMSGEPIECKICLRTMDIKTTDIAKLLQNKIKLYSLFPVNVNVLGQLALSMIVETPEVEEKKAEDYFIDLQAILDSTDQTQGQCLECHSATTKMCQQCATVMCASCFEKSHKNFVVFKNHILQNIEPQISTIICKIHPQKSLEYYCKDCAKSICMDCFMIGSEKSCKNHDVVPILEINEKFLSDLREILPQVDTTFRRLTKTAVDIGHQLIKMDKENGSPELLQTMASIEQHFSKLQAVVQNHKQEVMENIARLRRIERDSLLRIREDVAAALKQSKQVMNALNSALECDKNQTANLSALLEEAKSIVDKPWFLTKEESGKDKLQVYVSEELCLLVSDYVQLAGNAQARYGLRGSRQLSAAPPPPPPQPVFPPRGPELKKAAVQTVTPFAENKSFIELKAGMQEQARITYMQDPHNFYVRRVRDDALLAEIEEQLHGNLANHEITIHNGKIYAITHEYPWKRGRVDRIDIDEATSQPKYWVTFIDFGNTASVNSDRLREIPATLSDRPALALRCRLANCEPDGAWHPDDIALMLRIVDKSPVTLHVRRAGACSECDVTTRAGLSVAHVLRFHARAALADPSLPYPEVASPAPPRLQPADTSLRKYGGADVVITHVVSPDKFYVRESRLQTDYVKLCEELNNSYDVRDESDLIFLPKEGSVCAALVGEEAGTLWARAQVLSASIASAVRVLLPDTGRQLSVPWHRLRALRPRFSALRALAIECHLAGISPVGARWHSSAGELLAQHAGRELRLVAQDSRRRSLGAVLLDPAGPVCLNRELRAKQLATTDGSIDFEALTAEFDSVEKEPPPQSPVNSENATCKDYETVARSYQNDFQPGSEETIRLEAKILLCESPSLMYISLLHQQKTFSELFEDIQKFYAKRKTPRRERWKVNDRCCAFCTQSQTWRRATIIKTERDQVTVFYTDFAQTETVSIANLKKLHSDFELIGDAAIKCHLAGLKPAEGEWPSLTKEFLKDKLGEYKRVFVTKVGEFSDKSMPVQLWVYHTELGSALEPNESEWRCLNAELASRGLAVDTRKVEGATPERDDELRFLNVRGSVQEWLLPARRGSTSSEDAAEWLPAEPLQADHFTAVPTYIDNDGIIYLHDVSQEDDLEFIRDTLEMAFKAADPKAPYCSWRVGELCVARYYLDSKFYRGVVLEVDPGQATCLVQYVDYGNSETCAFTDLRKRVALHQIPIQSHKVSLARIKPVGEQWDQTVLDYIHKAIVEKKCFVKVAAPPVDHVTPVDLKYDKLWINDHLVEFDLAEYIDGSKPIERKFKKKSKQASSTPDKNRTVETETKVIEINSGSEPDYIVEEDIASSQASGSPDSFKMSTLVDHSGSASEKDSSNLLSYLRHEDREFSCNIPVINDTNSLELMVVQDPESHAIYEALLDIVKDVGKNMPPLDGIYEYKPCIALFEDHWYRASILKYSEAKNLVKVHYVDYGNIGIVPLSDVREISKDWVCLPPACVTARLHGVRVNPDFDPNDVTKAYIETFLDKGPFLATIVDYVDYDNSVPLVELRNSDGELVYKKLIEDKVLLHDTRDCVATEEN
ncbi:tudor domain-containing protein 1-like isoform X2 [Leguminivora glycinivorella]|uniref:tudor domain-containing protein 1-like isoform X2 n=1 Tax=Leguminivora glycinivorella TaxID=1035111 RepID=UPI00200F4349|nr:tudor domain-containing protein 1-like isoform X2 [Leguminivora glycinivorella]